MNPMAQPGTHPDADVLNAFAEHALPEAERARVVAHMADCARCREVVFMAVAAAEPAPVATAEPRPGWLSAAFAKWRVALIPAAALAAVGATLFVVQLRPVLTSTQMAKNVPPSAPPVATQARAPQEAPPLAKLDAVRRQSDSTPKSTQAERTPAPDRKPAPIREDSLMAMSDASLASPPASTFSAPTSPGQQSMHAQAMARQQAAQPPITHITVNSGSGASVPALSTMAQMSDVSPSVPAVFSPVAAQSASEPALAPQQLHGLSLLRLSGRVRLPNGLKAVSSAALLNRMVAVDAAGGLFFSEDGGMHWAPVHASWSGKAVEVNAATMIGSQGVFQNAAARKAQNSDLMAISAPSSESVPPAPPPPASSSLAAAATTQASVKAAPPVQPPLFNLVTDRREVWVSSDGKIWRRQ